MPAGSQPYLNSSSQARALTADQKANPFWEQNIYDNHMLLRMTWHTYLWLLTQVHISQCYWRRSVFSCSHSSVLFLFCCFTIRRKMYFFSWCGNVIKEWGSWECLKDSLEKRARTISNITTYFWNVFLWMFLSDSIRIEISTLISEVFNLYNSARLLNLT